MIQVEISKDYWQYACIIYGRQDINRENISYSIYPHRALNDDKLDEVRNALPEFNFRKI